MSGSYPPTLLEMVLGPLSLFLILVMVCCIVRAVALVCSCRRIDRVGIKSKSAKGLYPPKGGE